MGGDSPPRIPNSPRKTPKIQKTLKMASNLPPRYVFPPPQNLESRINTDVWVALYQLSVMLSRVSQVSGYPVICVRSNRQGNVDIKNIDYCIPLVVGNWLADLRGYHQISIPINNMGKQITPPPQGAFPDFVRGVHRNEKWYILYTGICP